MALQEFNAGDIPLLLGGIKSYSTPDDEVMLEMPIMWGSNLKVGSAFLCGLSCWAQASWRIMMSWLSAKPCVHQA